MVEKEEEYLWSSAGDLYGVRKGYLPKKFIWDMIIWV